MIKFGIFRVNLFGYNILALRFFKFKIFTDTMNDNPTFFTLQNIIGEPRADQLGAEITKIE